MLKIRRIVSIALISALILALAAGCKKTEVEKPETEKAVEVVYWMNGWGPDITNMSKELVNKFNSQRTDIKVKFQIIPFGSKFTYTGYDEKFLPAVAAGTAPDIFMPVNIPALVKENLVADITDYLAGDNDFDPDMFYPYKSHGIRHKGRVYMLPYDMAVSGVLLFNKTMFKIAGLDPNAPPKNIDEMDYMIEKLTMTNEQGDYTHVGMVPWNWHMKMIQSLNAPFGGKLVDENGNPTPTHEGNVMALEWIRRFALKYGYEKVNKLVNGLSQPHNPFKFGVVGLYYAYNGQINELIQDDVSFEWSVAPFPRISEDAEPTWGGGWNVCVYEGSKHKKEAVEFLKFYTGKDGQMRLMEQYEKANTGFSAIPEVNIAMKDKWHPANQLFVDLILPNVPAPLDIALPPNYLQDMNKAIDAVIEGKGEPRQLLEDVKRKTELEMSVE